MAVSLEWLLMDDRATSSNECPTLEMPEVMWLWCNSACTTSEDKHLQIQHPPHFGLHYLANTYVCSLAMKDLRYKDQAWQWVFKQRSILLFKQEFPQTCGNFLQYYLRHLHDAGRHNTGLVGDLCTPGMAAGSHTEDHWTSEMSLGAYD